ncbi:unnamed protein product [Sphenostylis stenocarpa]|uniref:Uncharacterized protein n=1 Tax=Sphenostylis stenocarpa TaxID=92480 RepID=A0AA86T380_9FABA|nr:unnamed protein product [Sphenostylis stenocarpa]
MVCLRYSPDSTILKGTARVTGTTKIRGKGTEVTSVSQPGMIRTVEVVVWRLAAIRDGQG